jgi:hypothetical protein
MPSVGDGFISACLESPENWQCTVAKKYRSIEYTCQDKNPGPAWITSIQEKRDKMLLRHGSFLDH